MSAPTRRLGLIGLAFVMFFNVSGGAFTTEALVAEVGPGLALLMLALVPLCWAVPEALIVAELASAVPEEGGYYRWVRRAFGRRWAFQNAWCTWLYSVVEMALYPVIFTSYLAYFVPEIGAAGKWGVALAIIWGSTWLNLRGANQVGRVSVAVGVVVLAAFVVLAALALPQATRVPWQPFTTGTHSAAGSLGVGLSIALWNFVGWDNASTVVGEIRDATRTYPRALAVALTIVTCSYFVPLLAALGATDWTTWKEGGWPDIAQTIGAAWHPAVGVGLARWVGLAGLISSMAMFNSLLLAYSRIPLALAADGLLPATLARVDENGVPRHAVIGAAVCYSLFALFPFSGLVVADVFLYATALALEMAALVQFRRAEPTLRGAFRIPLGTRGVALLALLPMLVLVLVIGLSIRDGEFGLPAILGACAAVLLGPLLYPRLARGLPTPARGQSA
ncbi:MAG: APC family permease [Gemmatimonadaceae bacterium]|nr:APC family permease [Gemmatimonadaceae bacterium]